MSPSTAAAASVHRICAHPARRWMISSHPAAVLSLPSCPAPQVSQLAYDFLTTTATTVSYISCSRFPHKERRYVPFHLYSHVGRSNARTRSRIRHYLFPSARARVCVVSDAVRRGTFQCLFRMAPSNSFPTKSRASPTAPTTPPSTVYVFPRIGKYHQCDARPQITCYDPWTNVDNPAEYGAYCGSSLSLMCLFVCRSSVSLSDS